MKQREIVLTQWGGAWCNRRLDISLCEGTMKRHLDIPSDVKKISACFNEEDIKGVDSYTISKPIQFSLSDRPYCNVLEFSGELTWYTKMVLGRLYKQGYRFVHFEYEV